MKERKAKVQVPHNNMSKRHRARLLGVNLSSCYVKKQPIDTRVVTIMNEIQDIYQTHPFKGYRRITDDLNDLGFAINHKRVYRLMKKMQLQAVYPKKNLSKRRQKDAVFPYLLKNYPPQKPHDTWCVDITYIKMGSGFVYLTALIDVVSRYVMGFSMSTCLDTQSCLDALEMAIKHGFMPGIINSDQGCQFTSQEWVYSLALLGVKVSMDGKGRCLDNIPIERFWRTIKYEEVYMKSYDSVKDAKQNIAHYIDWYNHKRRHSGIDKHRPYEIMMGLKTAKHWSFKKDICQNVENADAFAHNLTATTTIFKKDEIMFKHSSQMAA